MHLCHNFPSFSCFYYSQVVCQKSEWTLIIRPTVLPTVLFDYYYFCSIISSSAYCFSYEKSQKRCNCLELIGSIKEIVPAVCVLFRSHSNGYLIQKLPGSVIRCVIFQASYFIIHKGACITLRINVKCHEIFLQQWNIADPRVNYTPPH